MSGYISALVLRRVDGIIYALVNGRIYGNLDTLKITFPSPSYFESDRFSGVEKSLADTVSPLAKEHLETCREIVENSTRIVVAGAQVIPQTSLWAHIDEYWIRFDDLIALAKQGDSGRARLRDAFLSNDEFESQIFTSDFRLSMIRSKAAEFKDAAESLFPGSFVLNTPSNPSAPVSNGSSSISSESSESSDEPESGNASSGSPSPSVTHAKVLDAHQNGSPFSEMFSASAGAVENDLDSEAESNINPDKVSQSVPSGPESSVPELKSSEPKKPASSSPSSGTGSSDNFSESSGPNNDQGQSGSSSGSNPSSSKAKSSGSSGGSEGPSGSNAKSSGLSDGSGGSSGSSGDPGSSKNSPGPSSSSPAAPPPPQSKPASKTKATGSANTIQVSFMMLMTGLTMSLLVVIYG